MTGSRRNWFFGWRMSFWKSLAVKSPGVGDFHELKSKSPIFDRAKYLDFIQAAM
jgi:hypothetical protein